MKDLNIDEKWRDGQGYHMREERKTTKPPQRPKRKPPPPGKHGKKRPGNSHTPNTDDPTDAADQRHSAAHNQAMQSL